MSNEFGMMRGTGLPPPSDLLGLTPASLALLGRIAVALEDIASSQGRIAKATQALESHVRAARREGEAGNLEVDR